MKQNFKSCDVRGEKKDSIEKAARGVGWSQDKQNREDQIVVDNLSSADETSS